jgi:hypothetical protein
MTAFCAGGEGEQEVNGEDFLEPWQMSKTSAAICGKQLLSAERPLPTDVS